MSQREDDMLPERLRHELHDLVPSLPAGWDERNADLMGNAHRQVGRASLWLRAARPLAAAAAILLVSGVVWQISRPEPLPTQIVAEGRPTIIDVLRMAKRPDVSQEQLDRLAMSAVQIRPEVLQ